MEQIHCPTCNKLVQPSRGYLCPQCQAFLHPDPLKRKEAELASALRDWLKQELPHLETIGKSQITPTLDDLESLSAEEILDTLSQTYSSFNSTTKDEGVDDHILQPSDYTFPAERPPRIEIMRSGRVNVDDFFNKLAKDKQGTIEGGERRVLLPIPFVGGSYDMRSLSPRYLKFDGYSIHDRTSMSTLHAFMRFRKSHLVRERVEGLDLSILLSDKQPDSILESHQLLKEIRSLDLEVSFILIAVEPSKPIYDEQSPFPLKLIEQILDIPVYDFAYMKPKKMANQFRRILKEHLPKRAGEREN